VERRVEWWVGGEEGGVVGGEDGDGKSIINRMKNR